MRTITSLVEPGELGSMKRMRAQGRRTDECSERPPVGCTTARSSGRLQHHPSRQYGIPAVICVPDATNRLHDGQKITVDGSSGTVQLATSDERATTG